MEGNGATRLESRPTDESVRRLARRLVGREQDAEDLAQEVWLNSLRKPGSERMVWLQIVARRTIWRWNYREQARARRERAAARPEEQESSLDEVEAASLREYLVASVEALNEPYREVLRLHYLEDLSIEETCRRLERPGATVRAQLKRGLELLRLRLEGRRRRFLVVVPFSEWLRARRTRWSSPGSKRIAAAGGIASMLALVLMVAVLVRGERGRTATAEPGVASLSAATLDAARQRPIQERLPVLAEELETATAGDAPRSIRGRVLTHDGIPIAGAAVFLRGRQAAKSDADGWYEIESAGPRNWIDARPEGHLPSPRHLVLSLEEGRELDLIAARPAGRLRGRVRDANGTPVPGAEVLLTVEIPQLPASLGSSLAAASVTDERLVRASFGNQSTIEVASQPVLCQTDWSGRFDAAKPPGKKLLVLVQATGRAAGQPPALEILDTREGEDEELDFHLVTPASIEGRIVDPDGAPCAGARVELLVHRPLPGCETRTDANGRYRFEGLAPGPFVLRVVERSNGLASGHVVGRVAAGEQLPLDVELTEQASIFGTVEKDGRPLERWTVVLAEPAGAASPGRDLRTTKTGADGRFSFLGCSTSEYELEFFAPSDPAQRNRVSTRAGRSPLSLQPRPTELIPLRGRIVLHENARRPSRLGITAVRGGLAAWAETIELDPTQDVFTGPHLPGGAYYVDAFFPGSPTPWRKTVELPVPDLTLEIPGRGRLRLDVDLPGGSTFEQASAFVRLQAPITVWVHAAMCPDPRQQAFFMELLPGDYRVVVQLEGCAAEYLDVVIEESMEARHVVAPKRGVPAIVQIVAPGDRRPAAPLRLVVEEAEREIAVPNLSAEPGENGIWWKAVDLPLDARRLRAFTDGASATEGWMGELLLTEELLRSGAVLRVELKEPDPVLGRR